MNVKVIPTEDIERGTELTGLVYGASVVIGIAARDFKEGEIITVDLMKGPNQLIWPSDGKETVVISELTTKQLKEKEKENGKRY